MTQTLLVIALLGIASSFATEVVTWLTLKLNGTFLQGKAALLVAIVLAFVGGAIKSYYSGIAISWATLGTSWAQVFAAATVYFNTLAQWLNLNVTNSVTTTNQSVI